MTAISDADGRFVAIENVDASSGLDLGVYAETPPPAPGQNINTTRAEATTTTGDATATSKTSEQAGILNSTFLVGRNANFSVRQYGAVEAQANTVNGAATATSTNGTIDTAGGIINTGPNTPGAPDIKVGGNLFSNTVVNNFVRAGAGTVSGDATATAQPGGVYGQRNIGTTVGGNGEIISTVQGQGATQPPNFQALADTTTGNASATVGSLQDGPTPQVVGIYSSSEGPLNLNMGGNGVISATAGSETGAVTFVSDAETTTGNATASNNVDVVGGIIAENRTPGTAGGININIGGNTQGSVVNFVRGWGFGDSSATAKTTTGEANATSQVGLVGGIVDRNLDNGGKRSGDGSTIFVGGAGSIDGAAGATGNAYAEGTSGPTSATSNADFVVGIGLPGTTTKPGITIGKEGWIQANAASTQTATAKNVSGTADPTASAGNGDFVGGFVGTDTAIGANLSRFAAKGTLTATATAGATSDISTATAGVGSISGGVLGSNITVGGSLGASVTNPRASTTDPNNNAFLVSSGSNLTSTATTTTGSSFATSGAGASTFGIGASDITIGKDGYIESGASSTLASTATATNGPATATTGPFLSRGIVGSTIKIGQGSQATDFNSKTGTYTYLPSGVNGSSIVDAESTATGTTAGALTDVNSVGIDLAPADSITIGKAGNVVGFSSVTGGSSATATGSAVGDDATATATVGSVGLNLDTGSSVKIGELGSIQGQGFIGATNSPFTVSATANRGDATTTTAFSPVTGINNGGTSALQAGVLGGSVFGDAGINAEISATSANGAATVTPITSTVNGILGGTIQAGLATPTATNLGSSVRGTGAAIFDVSATSVNDKATAANTASVYGINGSDIKVGGYNNTSGYLDPTNPTVLATAYLSNTVTATSTNGAATATAGGSAIGLNNSSIDILGSGSIVASSSGQILAKADGNGSIGG